MFTVFWSKNFSLAFKRFFLKKHETNLNPRNRCIYLHWINV